MDQAQVARDPEQAGVWEEVKVVAAVGVVVLEQGRVVIASAPTVAKEQSINWGPPVMSSNVLSAELLWPANKTDATKDNDFMSGSEISASLQQAFSEEHQCVTPKAWLTVSGEEGGAL